MPSKKLFLASLLLSPPSSTFGRRRASGHSSSACHLSHHLPLPLHPLPLLPLLSGRHHHRLSKSSLPSPSTMPLCSLRPPPSPTTLAPPIHGCPSPSLGALLLLLSSPFSSTPPVSVALSIAQPPHPCASLPQPATISSTPPPPAADSYLSILRSASSPCFLLPPHCLQNPLLHWLPSRLPTPPPRQPARLLSPLAPIDSPPFPYIASFVTLPRRPPLLPFLLPPISSHHFPHLFHQIGVPRPSSPPLCRRSAPSTPSAPFSVACLHHQVQCHLAPMNLLSATDFFTSGSIATSPPTATTSASPPRHRQQLSFASSTTSPGLIPHTLFFLLLFCFYHPVKL